MNDSWIVNCEVCDCEIDKLDQEKGVYIVGDSENVCSEKCVEEVLGLTHLTKPKRMEARGDSRSYYWTYYEEKEYEYLDKYIDEEGNVDERLTLNSNGFACLTNDIENIVDKYTGNISEITGVESAGFMKCSEIREELMELIHEIINKKEKKNAKLV
jgi:hypothetical protein